MTYSSELTRQRILESAKVEFLTKYYLNANLKTIAENANVTTGALYRHFEGKDQLFYALFQTEFEYMQDAINNAVYSTSPVKNLISKDEIESSMMNMGYFIDYIYQHIDAFKLMFRCAQGSLYADLDKRLIDLYAMRNLQFFQALYQKGVIKHKPVAFEIRFISKVFFSATLECIYQGLTHEKAKNYIHSFVTYHQYGCYGMMGINDE